MNRVSKAEQGAREACDRFAPSTQIDGGIFSVSSGKVARVAFVVGKGWFEPCHSPEEPRDHADQIRDRGDFCKPHSTLDELVPIPKLFGMTAGAD